MNHSIMNQYNILKNNEDNESFLKQKQQEMINNNKENMLYSYDFKLPIEYHKNKNLTDIVKTDIEFNNDNNILKKLYNKNEDSYLQYDILLNKYSTIYSLDKGFLKENQLFISKFNHIQNKMNDFVNDYLNYKSEPDFMNKYQYIQFDKFEKFNHNTSILHLLGLYNFSTPVLSLIAPIMGLIIPYFVLLFKGIVMNISSYIILIKKIIYNNYIINGILNFRHNSLQKNAYTIGSFIIYIMSIYNNIILCITYYKNLSYLSKFMNNYNNFLKNGKILIENIKNQSSQYKSFNGFTTKLLEYETKIDKIINDTNCLCNKEKLIYQYGQLGYLLKCNYEIFNNKDTHDTILYLIYLNHYSYDMSCIKYNIDNNKISKCSFNKKNKKNISPNIKQSYYLAHLDNYEKCIKNDINLDKNMIITGPNASGKTTTIKSILINLFLSQSLGFGCYRNCKTCIYDDFYSYLNIPDTSNRDSLFQAEARRCKEIIETIEQNQDKRHFCIFDEIYSGTNPNDAVLCADIYLSGMNKFKNCVDYVLTTHYLDLCKKMDNNDYVNNKKMDVIVDNNNFDYTYKLIDGYSTINGGYKILVDLDYPEYLLKNHMNNEKTKKNNNEKTS